MMLATRTTWPGRISLPRLLITLAIPVILFGCRPDDQTTRSVDPNAVAERLGPGLMARLDSANGAFAAREFQRSAELYRSIAESAPDESVGWFGLYMAQEAMGNTAAADSALDRARSRSPGASLIRPGTDADTLDGGG